MLERSFSAVSKPTFANKLFILQHFSRSTRFTHFYKIIFLSKIKSEKQTQNNCTTFGWTFEVCTVQTCISLVDLVKSFPSNKYFIAKIGVDTAENKPLKIWWYLLQPTLLPPRSEVLLCSLSLFALSESSFSIFCLRGEASRESETITEVTSIALFGSRCCPRKTENN